LFEELTVVRRALPGRGRDRHPREEDERCRTSASRLMPPDPGRSHLLTRDDSGCGLSEVRRDGGLAARRVGTTCPRASEPSSGPRRVTGRPHERCLIRSTPPPETLDGRHITTDKPALGVAPNIRLHSRRRHLSTRRATLVLAVRGEPA
jgi:hypothetical protein